MGQSDLDKLYHKLTQDIGFFQQLDSNTNNAKSYQKALAYVKMLNHQEKEIDKLGLNISFGLNGNDNRNTSSFVFNTKAKITKEFYPYNLDVSASISTQFFNGVLQENISNYHASLDFFIKNEDRFEHTGKNYLLLKNNLTTEGYVYADRYANQFLNIDQRYEVGAGLIFNFYSGSLTKEKRDKQGELYSFDYTENELRGLTQKGKALVKKFYETPAIKIKVKENDSLVVNDEKKEIIIGFCKDKSCSPVPVNKHIKLEDNNTLKKARRKISNALKKKHSAFRVALLTGLFYEIEKGNASDSVTIKGQKDKEFISRAIPATNFLRWQFRPTFEFKTNQFNFKLKPYFKMPMPWEWNSKVASEEDPTENNKKVDYLIDGQASASYAISNKFNVTLTLRHIYDNAPKRVYVDFKGDQRLLSARNHNTQFNFSLVYKIL